MRIIRFLFAMTICTLLVFSSMFPAIAAGRSTPTKPESGEATLNRVQERSEDVVKAEPRSMKEVQEDSSGRKLNEVQGEANLDKMKRSENTSEQTESFRDRIEGAIENITGSDQNN